MTATAFKTLTENDRATRLMIAILAEISPAEVIEKVVAQIDPAQRLELVDIVTEHRARQARR
ncbi:hypothetical protein ACWEN6_24900 [Sphaerisporangium sp. NPDC004334]